MVSDEPEPGGCAPGAIRPREVVADPFGEAPLLMVHAFMMPDPRARERHLGAATPRGRSWP